MKVTIVVDNIEHAGIPGEWGFCAYIEQNGKKLLLDTGASNLFADNAEKLNIDLNSLPESQAGAVRHKSPHAAYALGYQKGVEDSYH